MKDAKQGAVCVKDLNSGCPDQILRLLVPTTAALFDLLVNVTILIVSQPIPSPRRSGQAQP
jgi:hypothetical protein